MDKYGVIWTRYLGYPVKLADMTLTSSALRITKTSEAIELKIPGVSLLHDKNNLSTAVFPRNEVSSLPPQLKALLPPKNNNPQYIIMSKLLARHVNVLGMPIIDQEWEMLLFAGRNSVGHLDVFKSDQDAERYYALPKRDTLTELGSSALWTAFKLVAEGTAIGDHEIEEILSAVGPTPGVTGFNPKLLTNIHLNASSQWDGVTSPSTGVPVLAKIDTVNYPGLIHLEALCYQYHKKAGLLVPNMWIHDFSFKGEKVSVMATERFDRVNDLPVPLESLYSLLKTGNPNKFFSNTDGSMEDVWKALKMVSQNSPEDRELLFSRFVLSFLTGNGDLHLENLAIIGDSQSARLSPVFDPAPMRAYRSAMANHDLLSAVEFSGIGGMNTANFAQSSETPENLFEKISEFGVHMGMSSMRCKNKIIELMEVTKDYATEAESLLNQHKNHLYRPKAPDIDGFIVTLNSIRSSIQKSLLTKVINTHQKKGIL